jgi:hypothetical protein
MQTCTTSLNQGGPEQQELTEVGLGGKVMHVVLRTNNGGKMEGIINLPARMQQEGLCAALECFK